METAPVKFTDRTPMPFGKYKGMALANVPAFHLIWLYNRGILEGSLLDYVEENMDLLEEEATK